MIIRYILNNILIVGMATILITSCSTTVRSTAAVSGSQNISGKKIVAISTELVGRPYRYGGESPVTGFDCSGLVRYVYRQIGITVPHSSSLQHKQSRRINLGKIEPGDLLFFRVSPEKISHVGIYLENGKFIHAPSSGKRVSIASLSNPYWKKRLTAAGRFH